MPTKLKRLTISINPQNVIAASKLRDKYCSNLPHAKMYRAFIQLGIEASGFGSESKEKNKAAN